MKKIFLMLAFVFAAGVVVGCGHGETEKPYIPPEPIPPGGEEVTFGRMTFRMSVEPESNIMDLQGGGVPEPSIPNCSLYLTKVDCVGDPVQETGNGCVWIEKANQQTGYCENFNVHVHVSVEEVFDFGLTGIAGPPFTLPKKVDPDKDPMPDYLKLTDNPFTVFLKDNAVHLKNFSAVKVTSASTSNGLVGDFDPMDILPLYLTTDPNNPTQKGPLYQYGPTSPYTVLYDHGPDPEPNIDCTAATFQSAPICLFASKGSCTWQLYSNRCVDKLTTIIPPNDYSQEWLMYAGMKRALGMPYTGLVSFLYIGEALTCTPGPASDPNGDCFGGYECRANEAGTTSYCNPSTTAFPEKLIVFVTNGGWKGGNLGGPAGADALCTSAWEAQNPGSSKVFKAWLSYAQDGKDVNARDRIWDYREAQWCMPGDGVAAPLGEADCVNRHVADSIWDLVMNKPSKAIAVDETGTDQTSNKWTVWTGTKNDGTYKGAYLWDKIHIGHCKNWDDPSILQALHGGWVGDSWSTEHWSEGGSKLWPPEVFGMEDCFETSHLYCFEQ